MWHRLFRQLFLEIGIHRFQKVIHPLASKSHEPHLDSDRRVSRFSIRRNYLERISFSVHHRPGSWHFSEKILGALEYLFYSAIFFFTFRSGIRKKQLFGGPTYLCWVEEDPSRGPHFLPFGKEALNLRNDRSPPP